ncbi:MULTISPECIES: Kunitz family serine protease inhibitor, partial [Terrabacteria group]
EPLARATISRPLISPITMATFSYVLAVLFLSGTLIASAAALCQQQGEAVLDTSGNRVRLGPNYKIEYTNADGRKGVLGLLRNDQSQCEKYVGPTNRREGREVTFASGSGNFEENTMKEGDRYVFSSIATWNHPCKLPSIWTTGKTSNDVNFTPIIAGQDQESNKLRFSLFQVTKAKEQEGDYKLSVCSYKQNEEQASCTELGTHDLNGQVVLGKNGDSFTVRFVKHEQLAMRPTIY